MTLTRSKWPCWCWKCCCLSEYLTLSPAALEGVKGRVKPQKKSVLFKEITSPPYTAS